MPLIVVVSVSFATWAPPTVAVWSSGDVAVAQHRADGGRLGAGVLPQERRGEEHGLVEGARAGPDRGPAGEQPAEGGAGQGEPPHDRDQETEPRKQRHEALLRAGRRGR